LCAKDWTAAWTTACSVLYISPLKALSNDIEKNLQGPLRGIRAVLKEQGLPETEIAHMVRTGDTTAAAAHQQCATSRRTFWSPRRNRSMCCSPA
jgi:Lhr-like helicase